MLKLFDKNGKEVKVGDVLTDFRGDKAKLTHIWQPGTSQGGRGGRVQVNKGGAAEGTYFPAVYDLKWEGQ